MQFSQEEDTKGGRYYPSESEMSILIHHLQIYFSHPERSIQRSQVVQKVAGILSPNNPHWTHHTIRLWFNNNKQFFYKPTSGSTPSSPILSPQASPPNERNPISNVPTFFLPPRSLSVTPSTPKIDTPKEVQYASPQYDFTKPIKRGSFPYFLNEAKQQLQRNEFSVQAQTESENQTSCKIKEIYDNKWTLSNRCSSSNLTIADQLFTQSNLPFSLFDVFRPNMQSQNSEAMPKLLSDPLNVTEFDLIECSSFTINGLPVVVSYHCQSNQTLLTINQSTIETGFSSYLSSVVVDPSSPSVWAHIGNNIHSFQYNEGEIIKSKTLLTQFRSSHRSAMTFWQNSLALSINSTILTWKPDVIYNDLTDVVESDLGVCITLLLSNIDILGSVDDSLIVASSDYHTAYIIASNGACSDRVIGHTAGITAICNYDNYLFITGSADQTAKLWDIRASNSIIDMRRQEGIVTSVYGNSSDGSNLILVGGTNGIVKAWDIRNMRPFFSIDVGDTAPQSLFYNKETNAIEIITSEKCQDYFFDLGKFSSPLPEKSHGRFCPNSILSFPCNPQ